MTLEVPQVSREDAPSIPYQVPDSIVGDILDLEASTFQSFLDSFARILGIHEIKSISLLAPSLHRRQQLELIASTSDDVPIRVWKHEEENIAATFVQAYQDGNTALFVSIHATQPLSLSDLFHRAIRTKVKEIVSAKRQLIRRCVIEQSIKSKDVNSFLHRMVHALQREFIFAGDISIFLHDEKLKKLYLAATTSELRDLEKKDIYYQVDESTPTVDAFRSNKSIVMDRHSDPKSEEFDKDVLATEPDVRGFWPISLAWSNFSGFRGQHIAAMGTIRIADPIRRRANRTWLARFSDYDQIIVGFIGEVIFVLVQQYQQFLSAETDIARLTHGIGANVEATIKFAGILKEMLFQERADNYGRPQYMPTFTIVEKHASDAEVYLSLKDLEFFLDDLGYQFGRIHNVSRYERETIASFHSDVLMPVVNLSPAIAAVNSKDPPRFPLLKSLGSRNIKPVIGNRKGFILVLRNLVENSVKYTKKKRAEIDFKFDEEGSDVIIDYFDKGIGVESHEVEQIFVEGFRSLAARRTSNRGIGIGLSSSREVMQALDGDLICLPHAGGAHFRLRMRKA